MNGSPGRNRQRGSSLVATFWLIATLGMVIFGATRFISVDGKLLASRKAMAFAKAQAESGLAIGAHPNTRRGDKLLQGEFDDGGAYAVTLSTEESRLNINEILKRNESATLARLFQIWGLSPQDASALADGIKDWVDADDLASLNGAERGAYPNPAMPFNRPFRSLDELALVRGMDVLEHVRPNWRNAFSMWAEGKLDVNTAAADLIAAVTSIDPGTAETFINVRAGADGVTGTFDDRRFSTVPEALAAMNIAPQLMASLDGALTTGGKTRRVESIGKFGDYRKKLVLISRGASTLWRGEMPTTSYDDSDSDGDSETQTAGDAY